MSGSRATEPVPRQQKSTPAVSRETSPTMIDLRRKFESVNTSSPSSRTADAASAPSSVHNQEIHNYSESDLRNTSQGGPDESKQSRSRGASVRPSIPVSQLARSFTQSLNDSDHENLIGARIEDLRSSSGKTVATKVSTAKKVAKSLEAIYPNIGTEKYTETKVSGDLKYMPPNVSYVTSSKHAPPVILNPDIKMSSLSGDSNTPEIETGHLNIKKEVIDPKLRNSTISEKKSGMSSSSKNFEDLKCRKAPLEAPGLLEMKIRSRVADRVAKFTQLATSEDKSYKTGASFRPSLNNVNSYVRDSLPITSETPTKYPKPPLPQPKRITVAVNSSTSSKNSSDLRRKGEEKGRHSESDEDDPKHLQKRVEWLNRAAQRSVAINVDKPNENSSDLFATNKHNAHHPKTNGQSPTPSAAPTSIHDYLTSFVALIGLDRPKVFGLEDRQVMSKNFFDYLYGTSLPMKEIVVIPDGKQAAKDFPPGLNLFVFPKGPKLETKKTSAFCHQFVLTMVNGSRLYGSSVCMFAPGDSEELLYFRSVSSQNL